MSLAFDVATALGIGPPNPEPIQVRKSYITLRVPEGISPWSLFQSAIGQELMWKENAWFGKYDWFYQLLPSGIYHLRIPIPHSSFKTFDGQKRLLLPGEDFAPLLLVALALLCMEIAGLPAPLKKSVRDEYD